ncbi:hypothetical protein C8R41DRAFT_866884 [Lentinula lateritia]|uniref:Uncharacterized protein n=1 Tax=Lentinula lateritia TaxID=40482 RepID=A0ABQ8VKA4_9AGAR|nr:hypothetical protein C8R41DRAFT_866884 [Lentinula lateritia]
MTTRVNESGNIELCSGKYGPRVKPGVILSPEDLDDLYEEAHRHAKTKATKDIENVREIIADAFPSRVHRDWFHSEKLGHLGLALESKDALDETAPPTFPFLDALRRKFTLDAVMNFVCLLAESAASMNISPKWRDAIID